MYFSQIFALQRNGFIIELIDIMINFQDEVNSNNLESNINNQEYIYRFRDFEIGYIKCKAQRETPDSVAFSPR